MASYPQVTIGKQVRRADGVLMEEVITSKLVNGNQIVSTSAYRPVAKRGQEPVQARKMEEAMDMGALLGEEDSEGDEPVKHVAPVAPRAGAGDNPTMDKMCVLKQLLQEKILSQAEYDTFRKQVLDEMMASGGVGKKANPSRVEGRQPRSQPSPESVRKMAEADDQRYIQRRYADVYANGKSGEARDKNLTMQMQPTGIDGLYYTGKEPQVVETVEEQLKDRKDGPEHKLRLIKTTIKKELLDTGVVRVTRIEMIYDGYSGAYLTMNKAEKMKPKLSFHSTEEYDWDKEFDMKTGTSAVEEDKVETWHAGMSKAEEDGYNRVMNQAIGDKQYKTRNVNNAAGKGDLGWDGVERYPGGRPVEPVKKEKKPLFGKKKPAKNAPKDKWSGFQDAWEDDPEDEKKGKGRAGGSKPGYKDGEKKGLFSTKKAQPKPSNKDKMMGEDVEANRQATNYKAQQESDREYMHDDGRGAGGFASGEQWGANAKQHEGENKSKARVVCWSVINTTVSLQENTLLEARTSCIATTGNKKKHVAAQMIQV